MNPLPESRIAGRASLHPTSTLVPSTSIPRMSTARYPFPLWYFDRSSNGTYESATEGEVPRSSIPPFPPSAKVNLFLIVKPSFRGPKRASKRGRIGQPEAIESQ